MVKCSEGGADTDVAKMQATFIVAVSLLRLMRFGLLLRCSLGASVQMLMNAAGITERLATTPVCPRDCRLPPCWQQDSFLLGPYGWPRPRTLRWP